MISRSLGETFELNGHQWRVVRIVKQISLFQNAEGTEQVEEHLLELKSESGHIDFEVLASERKPWEGPTSHIKAPEPIKWRLSDGE